MVNATIVVHTRYSEGCERKKMKSAFLEVYKVIWKTAESEWGGVNFSALGCCKHNRGKTVLKDILKSFKTFTYHIILRTWHVARQF